MTTKRTAGRPRLYPQGYVSRCLSLDKAADEAIAAYAKAHGLSRSQAASRMILLAEDAHGVLPTVRLEA